VIFFQIAGGTPLAPARNTASGPDAPHRYLEMAQRLQGDVGAPPKSDVQPTGDGSALGAGVDNGLTAV